MSKETLSAKQVEKIIEETNKIMANCKTKMEEKNKEFIDKVSQVWEDKNAVDYMKIHKQNFEEFVKELGQNNRTFANTVKDIAQAYAKVAGMALSIAVAPISLVALFDVSKVKEHFNNTENADDFGFLNPESGAEQVMDAFEGLKSGLQTIAADTISQIKSINAFGNKMVQLNLAQSAGKIVEILEKHVQTANTQIKDYVGKTANAYIKTGAAAGAAASLKVAADK